MWGLIRAGTHRGMGSSDEINALNHLTVVTAQWKVYYDDKHITVKTTGEKKQNKNADL